MMVSGEANKDATLSVASEISSPPTLQNVLNRAKEVNQLGRIHWTTDQTDEGTEFYYEFRRNPDLGKVLILGAEDFTLREDRRENGHHNQSNPDQTTTYYFLIREISGDNPSGGAIHKRVKPHQNHPLRETPRTEVTDPEEIARIDRALQLLEQKARGLPKES